MSSQNIPVTPALPLESGTSSRASNAVNTTPGCSACGALPTPSAVGASGYVYAIGRIEPRFPNISIEKELAQATARAETVGLSDRQAAHAILSRPENAYIARQLCWILTIEGIEAYVIAPHDSTDIQILVQALRPTPRFTDVDLVIGTLGPPAPARWCNGVSLPTISLAQVYSFDSDSFVNRLKRPEGVSEEQFAASAEELLHLVLQLADNQGASDEHRAANYVATRYPAVYSIVAAQHAQNASLAKVSVQRSALSSDRRIYEVIFTFRNRQTDITDSYFARVDVTELFPFLVTKLSRYYER